VSVCAANATERLRDIPHRRLAWWRTVVVGWAYQGKAVPVAAIVLSVRLSGTLPWIDSVFGECRHCPSAMHTTTVAMINTNTMPPPPDADAIADCVLGAFDQLPKKRHPRVRGDGSREWVPLAGIVLAKGMVVALVQHHPHQAHVLIA
jgi:hypothetical protein